MGKKKVYISRRVIDLDLEKMKEVHPEVEIECLMDKLDPLRDDWKQGMDSDCFGHCSNYDNCYNAWRDNSLRGENHYREIIVAFDKKPCFEDKEVKVERVED